MVEHVATWLFGSDGLTPHGFCLIWRPDLIWAFALAKIAIAAACFSMPFSLLAFAGRRRDVSFGWLLLLFGGFILLCGATHVMDVATIWWPAYGLVISLEVATGILSVATAMALWLLLPKAVRLPSTTQYEETDRRLIAEALQREQAQTELQALTETLENRVEERTQQLEHEVAERGALEDRLRQIIEITPSGLIMVNAEGAIEMVNSRAEDIFGYRRDELLGRPIEQLLPTGERLGRPALGEAFFANPAQREIEAGRDLLGLRKDGSEFPIEIDLAPMQTAQGLKVISSIVDISTRKQTERALFENEQQTRLMFDSIRGHAIYRMDPNGRVMSWNGGAKRLKGYNAEEVIGRHFSCFYPAEDAALGRLSDLLSLAARDGRVEDAGLRVRKNGQSFIAENVISSIRGPDGILQGFVNVTRDITDREQIEDQLLAANQRFELAAIAAGLGFWQRDFTTGLLFWDSQMYKLYGLEPKTDRGPVESFTGRVHPDDRTRVLAQVEAALAARSHFKTEYRIVWPDQSIRHLSVAATVKRNASDEVESLVGVSFDITARKQADADLKAARDAAEAASRAKSDFLATMSHEIRTPMNGIMGMNALLLGTELSGAQRKMADTVAFSANSLMLLIDGILDISKLEAGKINLEAVDFELLSVVDKVVDIFKPTAVDKNLVLTSDTSALQSGFLNGDPSRLRQILLNLVSNAIKFTPTGSVTLAVASDIVNGTQSSLRFEIRDTGPGVSEDMKQRLFKPFEQGDTSTTRRFGGSGLGLSICKRLVELMKGQIGVADRAGGGSVFWFEIDLPNAKVRPAGQPLSGGTRSREQERANTGHILLAEDNAVNRELAAMVLTSAGYTVDFAEDGRAAVQAMQQCQYDLVLMDMQMPDLDGLAATRAIRAAEDPASRVPIIALTANAMKEDRARCEAAGMDDYVSKPFDLKAFMLKVSQWVGKRSAAVAQDGGAADHSPADPAVVDDAALADLRDYLSAEKVAAILDQYCQGLERDAAELRRLQAAFSLDAVKQLSHSMAGSAGMFGAKQVHDFATQLQQACISGREAEARNLLDALLRACQRARETFQRLAEIEAAR